MLRQRTGSSEETQCSPHSRGSFDHNSPSSEKGNHRNRSQLALQHAWLMVLLPRSRKVHHGAGADRRGSLQRRKSESTHPPTQLWQPVSPFEECRVTKGKLSRSRSTSAVDLRRMHFGHSPRSRAQSHGDDLVANLKAKHLLSREEKAVKTATPATPTRSASGIPPLPGATPQAAKKTSVTTSCWNSSMDAHQVPTVIRVPSRGTSPVTGQDTETPVASTQPPLDDDVHSEVSLDHDLFMKQLSQDTSESRASRGGADAAPETHIYDHPLFQEAGDLSELYPPLSKFHNSVTTHDSTWGITTATLEDDWEQEQDASAWPSDEDKTPTKPRGRAGTVESIPTRDYEAATTTWGHLSCSGLQLCSAERVRQSFFNPVFAGKKIPWSPDTVATTITQASRDDDNDDFNDDHRINRRATLCKRESYNSGSWAYEEFQLSRTRTHTTESSSTWMGKSVRFDL